MIKENLEKDNRKGNNRDGKDLSEVKALTNQKKRWKSCTGALYSTRN
jgi:hypothetical protein